MLLRDIHRLVDCEWTVLESSKQVLALLFDSAVLLCLVKTHENWQLVRIISKGKLHIIITYYKSTKRSVNSGTVYFWQPEVAKMHESCIVASQNSREFWRIEEVAPVAQPITVRKRCVSMKSGEQLERSDEFNSNRPQRVYKQYTRKLN